MARLGSYRTVWTGGAGQYGTDWSDGQGSTANSFGAVRCGARMAAAGAKTVFAGDLVIVVMGSSAAAGSATVQRRGAVLAGGRASGNGRKAGSGLGASRAGARMAGAGVATSATVAVGGGNVRAGARLAGDGLRGSRGLGAVRVGGICAGAGTGQLTRVGLGAVRCGPRMAGDGFPGSLNTDHVREQIRDTIVGWMTGPPGVGARSFSARVYPIQTGEFPAIIVYTVDDRVVEQTMGMPEIHVRELELAIQVYAKEATDVDGALDDIAARVEERMSIDHNVNGLAKSTLLTGTEIALVEGETAIGTCTLTYVITYVIDPAAPYMPLQ
jgi:hypothetical protein